MKMKMKKRLKSRLRASGESVVIRAGKRFPERTISGVFSVTMIFLFSPVLLPAQKNSCLECHLQLEEELGTPAEAFQGDIHRQFGLSCQDCHGGNPLGEDIELAKDKSFRGAPARAKIPEVCGSCHSDSAFMRRYNPNLRVDQLDLYWTSRHGQILKKGDDHAAVCTDCHGVHGIQTSNFPKSRTFAWNIPETCGRCHSDKDYMKVSSLPTNQVNEYRESVHAQALFEKKDLGAPVCNDCHGNHGAAPPEVTSVAYVCRQCHPSAGDLFSRSPHKTAYDGLEISECEACHGNHRIVRPSDEMLAGGNQDICSGCHDAGTTPYEAGLRMRKMLAAFVSAYEGAEALLASAETKGVEVSQAKFTLQEANTVLIQVRNLTHSLSPSEIEAQLGDGHKVLEEVKVRGQEAIEEAKFRRTGLIVATVFLFLLAAALYLKIRDLRQK